MYIAAFGTDRVAQVDPNGNILARIEIDPQAVGSVISPATKRGPRGLAINTATDELYVMNRISNTISVDQHGHQRGHSGDPHRYVRSHSQRRSSRAAASSTTRSFPATERVPAPSCHVDGEGDHLALGSGRPHRLDVPDCHAKRQDRFRSIR